MNALERLWVRVVLGGLLLTALETGALAQTIVSVVPTEGATGVSTTASVVFTFSDPMNPDFTSVFFFNAAFSAQAVTQTWSAGDTVLTCTPVTSFTANNTITWFANGEDTDGFPLVGTTSGTFSTGTGGGGGGSGTNKTTTFTAGRGRFYDQTSTNVATLDSVAPYSFTATVGLASNRTASSVDLTKPNAVTTNIPPAFGHPESFNLFASSTNLGFMDSNYPTGNYTFVLQPSNSLTAIVNLSAALVQPGIPHVSNYTAAHSVNASNSFQLIWDAFPGGTATDYVSVSVGTNFQTGGFGATNALNGTATSVTIPGGTLGTNTTNDATIGFYRAIVNTNNSNYTTIAYLGSVTYFTIVTIGATNTNTIVLTNWAVSNGFFSFDLKTAANLTVRVDYNTNLLTTNWFTLTTTNSGGTGTVRVNDPTAVTGRRYYRGHIGP